MTRSAEAKLRRFGRYELLMEMARGGMATIYLARLSGPESFSKLSVLKRIHEHLAQDKSFIRMFLDEARIAALIEHPNVATVFDLGDQDGVYFLNMEYVHGEDLLTVLKQLARAPEAMTWHHAARIVCDAAAGLHAAHETTNAEGKPLGVVHRDVSPHNILIGYKGHVKVVDFGIAYAAERLTQTDTNTVKGKAAYMSPEQVNAELVDRRSDVFALGILLYETVCRRRLFRASSDAATLLRVSKAEVPCIREVRPDLPEELERVILKALQRNPAKRYQTAGELHDDLEQLLVTSDVYVGSTQLATAMSELFAEEIVRKDKQLRDAQSGLLMVAVEPTAPFLGADSTLPSGARVANPEARALSGSSLLRTSRLALWGGLAAVATIAVLVVLLVWRPAEDSETPSRAPSSNAPLSKAHSARPRPPMERPAAAKPTRKVSLKVTIRPARAEATLIYRGRRYSGSVVQLVIPRSDQPERLLVVAPGFRDKKLIVTPIKDTDTVVTLVVRGRKRPRRWRRPPHRPAMRAIDYIDSML